jgi:serine/threonine-protein kinase
MKPDDPRAIADTAAARLGSLGPIAFHETVGVLSATVSASSPGPGPRALRTGDLPPLSVDDAKGGPGGDLVVTRTIGEGGMGVVELVRQRSLQRDVAIKRARPGADDAMLSALLREAMFTGFLEHPNIVPVHALGRDAHEHPVMMMKKIEGISLADLVARPEHPGWERSGGDRTGYLLEIGGRLCDALAFAHSRGVLHRDIKPANVMVGEFGEVYLLDWGIATRVDEAQPEGAIAGTLAYMAPEMLRPDLAPLSERTDVYLLGATLHECFTGAPPHAGTELGPVLLSIAESRPRDYGDQVSEELALVLHRAMHAAPGQRYESAATLRRALAEVQSHRAAADLAGVATVRLVDLEQAIAEGVAARVYALFHECRFAFEQSLRAWSQGEAAKRGIRRALLAMAGFEIAQRNHSAAEALIATLDPAPSDLVARLGALHGELARERQDRDRLRRIEHDLDDEVASHHRTMAMRAAAVVVLLTVVAVITVRATGIFRPNVRVMSILMAPSASVVALVLYRWRAQFFANRINRQMGLTVATVVVAVSSNRVIGAFVGRSVSDVASGDALIIAAVAAVSALTLRRMLYLPASFFWIAAMIAPAFGDDRALFAILGAAIPTIAVVLASPRSLRAPALDRPGSS